MSKNTMEAEQTRQREQNRIRRTLQHYYPFDDVGIWLIEREHLATFIRYMPIHTIPVDDVVFVKNWLTENT